VVYLVFNEGYLASAGDDPVRAELCAEAIRLARLLVDLMPDEAEAWGLLALLLLTESRRASRVDECGELVLLADQDRSRWDLALIEEGQAIVRSSLRVGRPGPYQVQAAIAAVHSDAADAASTDWSQIVALYDLLWSMQPTAVVALNRAIAVAERDGPEAGLELVDRLSLQQYHLFHATRAVLLDRLGRFDEAAAANTLALELTDNPAERELLTRRLA
jgi:RNA polymerase sigma-70 factor (ECF subfamily)